MKLIDLISRVFWPKSGCVYLGGVFFCFVYILRLPSRPFHKTAWAIRQARAHYKAEKSPKFLTRPRHAHDCTDFPQNSWADYGRAVWAECKQSWKTLPPIRSLVRKLGRPIGWGRPEVLLVGEDPFVEENTWLGRSFREGKTKLGKGKMNEAMKRDFFFQN